MKKDITKYRVDLEQLYSIIGESRGMYTLKPRLDFKNIKTSKFDATFMTADVYNIHGDQVNSVVFARKDNDNIVIDDLNASSIKLVDIVGYQYDLRICTDWPLFLAFRKI